MLREVYEVALENFEGKPRPRTLPLDVIPTTASLPPGPIPLPRPHPPIKAAAHVTPMAGS